MPGSRGQIGKSSIGRVVTTSVAVMSAVPKFGVNALSDVLVIVMRFVEFESAGYTISQKLT